MESSDIAELNNDKDIFKSKKLFVQFLSRDQSHIKSTRILQILVLGFSLNYTNSTKKNQF